MANLLDIKSIRFKFLSILILIISFSYIILAFVQVKAMQEATNSRLYEILKGDENIITTTFNSYFKLLDQQKSLVSLDRQLQRYVKCYANVEIDKLNCSEKLLVNSLQTLAPDKSVKEIVASDPSFREELKKMLWKEIDENSRSAFNQLKAANPDINKLSFYFKDKAIYRSNSSSFNDRIKRKIISASADTKKGLFGIDNDKGEIGIFLTIPIFFPKNYIIAEIGLPVSALLRDLLEVIQIDYAAFVYKDQKIYSKVTKEGKSIEDIPQIDTSSFERNIQNGDMAHFSIPVKDFSGEVMGKIVLVKNVDHLLQEESATLWRLGILFVSTNIFLIIIIIPLFSAFINKPLSDAKAKLTEIAEGNLTEQLKVKSDDEIGEMISTMNSMSEGLTSIIRDVRNTVSHVLSESNRISSTANDVSIGTDIQSGSIDAASSSLEEINASIHESTQNVIKLSEFTNDASLSIGSMSQSIDEVARIAEQLYALVDDISSSILEMAASVKETADHTSNLNSHITNTSSAAHQIDASITEMERNIKNSTSLSEKTEIDAKAGKVAVDETIKAMNEIDSAFEESINVITRVGDKSEDIGDILRVIDGLSKQTNLLALNASIIAVQAGEHGAGFAVVADQIEELAARTQSATNDISELIIAVQEESAAAIEKVAEGGLKVKDGVSLSQEAGASLSKIINSANSSKQMVDQIATAASEQLKGSHQVSAAMEEAANMMNKLARSLNEQKQGSAVIANASEQMKGAALQVKENTLEQSEGGQNIRSSLDNILHRVMSLKRAATEESTATKEILKDVESIKDITGKNALSVKDMLTISNDLLKRANALEGEMAKFQLKEDK